MNSFRIALDYFAKSRLRHWPGLAFYFFGFALCKGTGLRLFQKRRLQFDGLSVVAEVSGNNGLCFLHQILVEEIYRLPALESGPPANVLFDVGANCGFYALTLCGRRPDLRAFCFEPHPVTFQRLEQNIAANPVGTRVQAVHAAVGAAPGNCEMNISPDSSMAVVTSSPVQLHDRAGRPMTITSITVPMVTLDDFAARENHWPDLIKVDVEGFEPEVLRGAGRCLERARFIIAECDSDRLGAEIESILVAAGFRLEKRKGILFGTK